MIYKLAWEWEQLDEDTYRARVIGGWVLRYLVGKNITMVFLPDHDHRWTIVKPFNPEEDRAKSLKSADFARPLPVV